MKVLKVKKKTEEMIQIKENEKKTTPNKRETCQPNTTHNSELDIFITNYLWGQLMKLTETDDH